MPIGILTGTADRLAAFIMAGYCGVTALLWKQFWKPGDFWRRRRQQGPRAVLGLPEELLAGGRLPADHLRHRAPLGQFLSHPLASTHPYTQAAP